MGETRPTHQYADKDGHFRRKDSVFRDAISKDSSAKFAAEKDRYVLYVNYGCPWAHRTIIVRGLKSLESIIQLVLTDIDLTSEGWLFTGKNGSQAAEPLYGFTNLKQLYLKANPDYEGRYTVPVLWDKKNETIVNNESSEIIRMLYDCFDDFLEPHLREVNKPGGGFYPSHLRPKIDKMNDWVYNTVNNGVYKVGFATSQEAYDANVFTLFQSLDRLESHLALPQNQPYLFGENITEADIRLYTTIARFDVAYHTIFQCNLKMIRHDYPRLYRWFRRLYWDDSERTNNGTFKKTTFFDMYKYGYLRARTKQVFGGDNINIPLILPRGPIPDIHPFTNEEEQKGINNNHANVSNVRDPTAGRNFDGQASNNETRKSKTRPLSSTDNGMGSIFGAESDSLAHGSHTPANNEASGNGEANDTNETGVSRQEIVRRTSYNSENSKWYKAAKKAQKENGAPNMHLAL